jgi:hypothetical protein
MCQFQLVVERVGNGRWVCLLILTSTLQYAGSMCHVLVVYHDNSRTCCDAASSYLSVETFPHYPNSEAKESNSHREQQEMRNRSYGRLEASRAEGTQLQRRICENCLM